MSTVRIQNRRGLASEWVSVNPILAAGEQGLETDTNLIKFGNGSDHWLDLPYANVTATSFANTLADYVPLSDVGQPNGVASLNSSGKIPSAQLDIVELSQDAVANALVVGSNIDITYNDTANHITIAVSDNVNLTGDLTTPLITFQLDAPQAPEAGKALLSRINSDPDELNRQFFSLMLFNKFQPLQGGVSANESAAFDLVESQINAALAQLSKNYQVKMDIGASNISTSVQKSFLNDRLIVSGSIVTGKQIGRAHV